MRILTVCTANICRSPLAAALLSQNLAGELGVPVEILSRGTRAEDGYPACPLSFDAAGLSLPNHESVRLSRDDIAQADLILTAEAAHRAAVVTLHPASRSRVFTFTEAAALSLWLRRELLDEGEDRQEPAAGGSTAQDRLAWWVVSLNGGRGATAPTSLDINDPHGERYPRHDAPVKELILATSEISAGLIAARIL